MLLGPIRFIIRVARGGSVGAWPADKVGGTIEPGDKASTQGFTKFSQPTS